MKKTEILKSVLVWIMILFYPILFLAITCVYLFLTQNELFLSFFR